MLCRFLTHLIHGLRIMNQNLSVSGQRVGHNSIPIDSHVCEGSKPPTSAENLRFHVSSLRMLQDIQSLLGLMASFWIYVSILCHRIPQRFLQWLRLVSKNSHSDCDDKRLASMTWSAIVLPFLFPFGHFLNLCFPAFLLFCVFAFCFFAFPCFSAFCFSVFLPFPASLLLRFSNLNQP